MTLLSALLRLALLLAAGLFPALAVAALDETYEGLLLPENFDPPIPITVQLRELNGMLTGRVSTGTPLAGSALIAGGENEFGKCTVRVSLPSGVSLRLVGSCLPSLFEGRYTILNRGRDNQPQGSFRLARKETRDDAENPRRRAALPPTHTLTDCIRSNTRCLTGCPLGDYNVELLCASRCRQKFQSCKGKAALAPPPAASVLAPSAEEQR